ncbi:MAG: NADH-quinone oxidoreductase subunit N [Nitrososphaerota archaeon]|nr:NADH-quinone oxidoreductase subunit N [Nitrososphaerota archaeon]MDG7023974.1 NADH-quinone oxidoreductase subunit N [Nitrososphaerota archaeon]
MIDYLTLTVIILGAAALALPLLQLLKGRSQNLAGYILAVVLAASIVLIGDFTLSGPNASGVPWAGTLLHPDQLGGIFALVTLGVTLAVTVASFDFEKGPSNPVYYSLLAFTALGMVLLAYSQDLLMLFVAWELMSLPTYVLAGFSKTRQSNEASVKYAIIGAMSSAVILYAISLAYGLTGSTQISAVVAGFTSNPTALAGVATLLFVAGFGFKMSIVPFHMWIPDAYEGAPTTISTLLAAATKKAGFIAAIRVLLAITTLYAVTQSPIFTMANVFAVLALVTMTLGNVSALTQKSMTRLLAYSSIAQAGYMLIGFVAFSNAPGSAAASLGLTGTIFHVINHAVMKGVAFLAAALVVLQLKRADLRAYDGLAKRMPLTAFTLAVAFLGLAGVPPLSGFWSKLLLVLSVANGPYGWLALAAILNSAFSLGYYAWVIKRMYMDEGESTEKVKEPFWFVIIFAIMVGLIIGIGLFPQQVISFASSAANSVVG